jgi:hypothetical protein
MAPRAGFAGLQRWIAPVALVLALGSLVLNGMLLWRLREPERLAAPVVMRLLDRLEAEDARIRYEVRIPVGTPLHFDIPFDQRYNVRLNTVLPIDTRVRVPFRSPLGGTYQVSVPIRTDIPIRTTLPVHLRDTFRLRTETRAEIVAPLEIRVRDLPLDAVRETLQGVGAPATDPRSD